CHASSALLANCNIRRSLHARAGGIERRRHYTFRLPFGGGLMSTAFYIALTALFYGLFKPVNRTLALLAAFFSLAGCAIQAFGSVFQLAPLVVLGGSPYLSVFKAEQLQALALMFLKLNTEAADISLAFFGLFIVVLGYLR